MEGTQKNNKNLLIISLHADPTMPPGVGEWGGTHTYMRELLTELYEENFNVILLTRKVYEKQDDIEKVSSSCKIVRLTLGAFGDFDKRELFELHELTLQKSVLTLKELNFRPDIIHSVYWNSGHLALKLSKMWGIPYVHSVISNGRGRNAHGAKGTANKRIETEEKVFENASFILCVAESEKNELCQLYGIQPEKIVVAGQYVHPAFIHASHNSYGFPRKSGIHYKIEPVYLPDLKPAKSKTSDWWNSKVFVYTGRLSLDKGLSYIVQAWYLLYQKYGELCPALWIIGGSTCDIENIRSLLGISEDVLCEAENSGKLVWWGYLDENGISALYTRALVLITHSLYEPGGRVAVEAMCEGLPVLATPNGFALDSVQDWKNGFLISYADTKTLAVRMEHFIKQPYLSDIMGRQAKKISHVILRNWDFIGSHLAVYHAALLHRKDISKKKYSYPFNASIQRKLCLYPYNQVLIDKTDILQIAEENQIEHILSIEKLEIPDCSSEIWEIQTQTSEYYVKIPYDRINLFALWSQPKEQPLVIPASKRYAAEIGALKFHGIPPVVGKKDSLYALIRKKYISVKLPTEQMIDKAIASILEFYKNNNVSFYEIETYVNATIDMQNTYTAIDQHYMQLSTEQFGWQNYFRDYSLRTELLRWKAYYHELPPVIRESIVQIIEPSYSTIRKISSEENNLHFVMNHGGFDMKNLIFTPDIILLDNEKLHPGWPGIDFADILITYVRFLGTIETYELWDTLFRKIPSDIISTNLLAGWVILGTYKEAISMAACLKPIPRLLQERIEILLHFIK
jgi:glycosyltransferase involved in cell wall biosynthesis